ncbi:MAG: hypothetical protein VW258_00285 [Thalassolituus sp.]
MKNSVFHIVVAAAVSTMIAGCGGTTEDDYDVDTNGGMIRWYQYGWLTEEKFSPTTGTYFISSEDTTNENPWYSVQRLNHSGEFDLSLAFDRPVNSSTALKLLYLGTPDEAISYTSLGINSEGVFQTANAIFHRVSDGTQMTFNRDISVYGIEIAQRYRIDPIDKYGIAYYTSNESELGWAISESLVAPADTTGYSGIGEVIYNPPPLPEGYSYRLYSEYHGDKHFRLYFVFDSAAYGVYTSAYLSVYETGKPDALWHAPIDFVSDVPSRNGFEITPDGVFIDTVADANGCVGTLLKYNDDGITSRNKLACNFAVSLVADNNHIYGEVAGDQFDSLVLVIQHRDDNDNVLQEYRLPARADNFPGKVTNMRQLVNGRLGVVISSERDSTGADTPWDALNDVTYASDVLILNSDMSLYALYPFHENRDINKVHWYWHGYLPLRGSTNGYLVDDVFMSDADDVYFAGRFIERDFDNRTSIRNPRFGVIH